MPFRFSFPFGRPEGALRGTLSLLEHVLMKDTVTPVPPEAVRGMIKSCLETAALVNYERLSAAAKIEDDFNGEVCVPPGKKLEDLIHLAELCVDLLQQNEEHYSEVLVRFLELSVIFPGLSSKRVCVVKKACSSSFEDSDPTIVSSRLRDTQVCTNFGKEFATSSEDNKLINHQSLNSRS